MNTQRIEFKIGLMAISAFFVLVVMTLQFSNSTLFNFGSEYAVRIRFESASGVTINVPVLKSGVEIGRVSKVQLVDDDREVEVTAMIRSDRILYNNEECRLKPAMLVGRTSLEFVRRAGASDDDAIPLPTDGTVILRGIVPADIFNSFSSMEGDLSLAIREVATAAEGLATFLGGMNSFLGDEDEINSKREMIQQLLTETTGTMRDLRVLVHNTNNIVGDPSINANLRDAAQAFPGIIGRIDATGANINDLVQDVRGVAAKVNAHLDDLQPVFDAVRDDVPAITGAIRKGSVKVQSIFEDVSMLVESINRANGTIKQLINDPALYNSVLGTVQNAERLTTDLQPILRDVKPITHNARVLTDKLARNPGVLISGALRKPPPLKGGLPSFGDELGSDCTRLDCLDDCIVSVPKGIDLAEYYRATQPEKKSCLSIFAPKKKNTPQATMTVVPASAGAACSDCGQFHSEQHSETYPIPYSTPYPAPYPMPQPLAHTFPPISLVADDAPSVVATARTVQTSEYQIPNKNQPTPRFH